MTADFAPLPEDRDVRSLEPQTLLAAYRAGSLGPRAVLARVLERARALNPRYHLFISLLDEAQLEPYLAALEGVDPASLPLFGLPFAIKDNLDLAGVPTTAACPDFSFTPTRSASVVERLIALGAIPVGKANLDQFATGLNGSRSPYGACPNSHVAGYPSGGSSAGSALAVALGVASFALGTDTAGSGRVPAALNDLVGVKPSCGLLSTTGLLPACRTLDCVTLFTAQAESAASLLALLAVQDDADPYSRRNPAWNASPLSVQPARFHFGVPRAEQLEWLGFEEGPVLFAAAQARLEALGGVAVEIDFAPFYEAARLLYEGPWVAERYAALAEFAERQPEALLPVIRDIVLPARDLRAVDLFRAQYHLQALKRRCDSLMDGLDLVLTPTIPRACTSAELRAEPIRRNSELGVYTNFMNLLDYAAVAVPAGFQANGLPWGVTLFGRCFTDQYLLRLAAAFHGEGQGRVGSGSLPVSDRQRIVVCGAHLDGLPLNHQLRDRGARLLRATDTAAQYRLYALAGGPPARPGLVRVGEGGVAIAVEVWELPSSEVGSFLAGIPAPLGLGRLQLADGSWETGFICTPEGLRGATDISEWGGWKAWRASLA